MKFCEKCEGLCRQEGSVFYLCKYCEEYFSSRFSRAKTEKVNMEQKITMGYIIEILKDIGGEVSKNKMSKELNSRYHGKKMLSSIKELVSAQKIMFLKNKITLR